MSQPLDSDETSKNVRRWIRLRWFQFTLRTALWGMVVLAVALAWLSDRIKLKKQLAQERAEKEGLRAARDYSEQGMNPYNPWGGVVNYLGSAGWQYPHTEVGGEAEEATVEHLKEYLGGEPIYSATVDGSVWLGGTVPAMRGDSV